MLGTYNKDDKINVNECTAVYELLSSKEGVIFDVGASYGSVSAFYAREGWCAYAFEPNPDSYAVLLKTAENNANIKCFDYALSDVESKKTNFYTSDESIGVSSLLPFTEKHVLKKTVQTKTLAQVIDELKITHINFLKIDTEGYDYNVLKGMNWNIKPDAIVVEYEDNKTKLLGYHAADMADYLQQKGYEVFVSQWHPIVRYGIRHSFMCLMTYPCDINPKCWGNLIAFNKSVGFEKIKQAYLMQIGFVPGQEHETIQFVGSVEDSYGVWQKIMINTAKLNIADFLYSKGIKQIIIFGIGYNGKALLDILQENKNLNIYLADTNQAGSVYKELPILTFEEQVQKIKLDGLNVDMIITTPVSQAITNDIVQIIIKSDLKDSPILQIKTINKYLSLYYEKRTGETLWKP